MDPVGQPNPPMDPSHDTFMVSVPLPNRKPVSMTDILNGRAKPKPAKKRGRPPKAIPSISRVPLPQQVTKQTLPDPVTVMGPFDIPDLEMTDGYTSPKPNALISVLTGYRRDHDPILSDSFPSSQLSPILASGNLLSSVLTGYKQEVPIDPFFLDCGTLDESQAYGTPHVNLSETELSFAEISPNKPAISVNDILCGHRISKRAKIEMPGTNQPVNYAEDLSYIEVTEIYDVPDSLRNDTSQIETQIYQKMNVKSVNAMDIFTSLKSKDQQSKQEKEQERQEQKLKKERKTRLKKSFSVILRLSPHILETIKPKQVVINVEEEDPFFTKGNVIVADEGTPLLLTSFLRLMVDRSSTEPRMTAFQKAKDTPLPTLSRQEFHVVPETETIEPRVLGLALKKVNPPVINLCDVNLVPNPSKEAALKTTTSLKKAMTYAEILHNLAARVPSVLQDGKFEYLLDILRAGFSSSNTIHGLWVDILRPQTSSALLANPHNSARLKTWIENSFQRLKKHSGPRFQMLKKASYSEMDDFIDDGEGSTEEDVFVPLMILTGPQGSGKSSAVAACMKECHGYVHEINSGQARGKKDIMAKLNELSTTHLVHKHKKSSDGFQKGLLLFENVDVLFEQDNGFWVVLNNVLNVGRRPVVITCEDPGSIPRGLIQYAHDEYAFLEYQKAEPSYLADYLGLCCMALGYDVDADIVKRVVAEHNCDIRKCLNELQFVCQTTRPEELSVEPIDVDEEAPARMVTSIRLKEGILIEAHPSAVDQCSEGYSCLSRYAENVDTLSLSDIILTGECSNLNHEAEVNEIVDSYIIPSSAQLSIDPLPFEVTIGNYLQERCIWHGDTPTPRSYNSIRNPCLAFFASKYKRFPILQERKTRMANTNVPENIKLRDSDALRVLPNQEMVLTLAPVIRHIARREIERRVYFSTFLLNLPRSNEAIVPDYGGWDGRRFEADDFTAILSSFIQVE
ncbi:hypothetical protein BABINDRAFT_174182 [Babjeviella inositovora NRRL Y-12698]|uniref:ATPase AAA-type core domain-containing protein n=1 Tax=Babjeviella inositovora NRRL Y-12698 TaxID=984486 RepID=A0A1E3QV54_9ASCO|nr:uncharacterized protein BABINDRAFT_174182 [Babjeviella inositovora NRRL Y-12698]ODQ81546.1 hypothetical protein BABINDRAFT_174182 [Babjeviella inositovora NRRL Y-12698]